MNNADLANMTKEELIAMIAAAKAQANSRLTLKVSEKGAVCLYGLGRFPVTLYASQWSRLLDQADMIRRFMSDNKSRLATKD